MNKYPQGQPTAIVIHHEAGDINGTVEKIKAYHLTKGWSDIGYHKVIEYPSITTKKISDLVKDGRPEDFIGAHCIGFNSQSLGICLVGNWTKLMPHPGQLDALVAQLHIWMDKYNIKPENIFTHREKWVNEHGKACTECPGDALQLMVEKIRQALKHLDEPQPAAHVPEISDSLLSQSLPSDS